MATIGGKPLSSLRVVDLKEELEKRGLSKSGVGKDLVERLSEWMLTNSEGGGAPPGEEAGVAVGSPPNVNLAQNLAENDMVQEYLRMRQQNFESTMSEVASSSPSSQKELKQDEAEEAKIEAKRQAEEAKQEEERLALEAKRQEEARKEQESLAEEARQEQLALEAKKEQERLAKEARKEQERLALEAQKEQERLAKEAKKEQERLAKEAQKEQERLAKEAQKEQERLAKEAQKEQERLAKEARKEQERLTAEKERAAENERLALEKKRAAEKHALEAKRQEEARKEQERLAEESRHEQERLANEAKKEQEAKEAQMKQERLAKEAQQEKERLEAEAQRKEEAQKEKQRQEQEDKQAREEEAKRKGEQREDQQPEQKVQQSSPDDEDGKEDEIIVAASPIDLDMDSTVNNEPSREEDRSRQDEEQTFVSELQAAEAPPPPEEVTYRKLNRQQTSEGSKRSAKRGWGKTSRSNSGEMDESISSSQLKDIVPDIKPYLEDLNAAAGPEPDQMIMEIEEQQPANHKTLPVPTTGPTTVAAKQHNKSSKDTMPSNTGKTCVICVRKLVRPFTTGQLRELLSRTGTIADFWIDKIKSTALVEYSSQDEAEETLMALDGVRWPSVGPETLEVTFSSRDLLDQAKTDNAVPQATKDRDLRKQPPASQPQKRKRSRSRSKERPAKQPREEETAKPKISLDTLFRKTKAMPCIYWQPKAAAAAASKDNKAK